MLCPLLIGAWKRKPLSVEADRGCRLWARSYDAGRNAAFDIDEPMTRVRADLDRFDRKPCRIRRIRHTDRDKTIGRDTRRR